MLGMQRPGTLPDEAPENCCATPQASWQLLQQHMCSMAHNSVVCMKALRRLVLCAPSLQQHGGLHGGAVWLHGMVGHNAVWCAGGWGALGQQQQGGVGCSDQ